MVQTAALVQLVVCKSSHFYSLEVAKLLLVLFGLHVFKELGKVYYLVYITGPEGAIALGFSKFALVIARSHVPKLLDANERTSLISRISAAHSISID